MSPGATITVRYFAAARAAAGVSEERLAGGGHSLSGVLEELVGRHGAALAKVLGVASFLVDGVAWRDREAPIPADSTVDVLPPFAGG